MPHASLQLAMIQMAVEGGEADINLRHAADLIRQAAEDGAQLALLPECMDLGWTHPSTPELAAPIPSGTPFRTLQYLAKELSIHICAGLAERDGNHVFNAAVLIAPDGQLLLRHRKLNELAIAHDVYAQGDSLSVVHTSLGHIGILICSDAFAQHQTLSRSLGYMGADLILSPCAWAVDADHDNDREPYGDIWRNAYIPVAREFSLPIIGVSNVGPLKGGPWEGRNCIGNSMAIGPSGEILAQGRHGADAEEIILIEVPLVERPKRGDEWAGH